MRARLPDQRATRVATPALVAVGILWASSVSLRGVAAALPLAATDPSTEQRLRRWPANPAVDPRALWRPLLPSLLADEAGREAGLVFDPSPHRDRSTRLCLGLIRHKRALPVAWRVVPQQPPWPVPLAELLAAMSAEVAAALPAGCVVTLGADRGLVGPALPDACRAAGWHLVLRPRAGAGEAGKVRFADGTERRLAEVPTRPGPHWHEPAAILKGAGWRAGWLTVHWAPGATEPWVRFSDRPGGPDRVRESRRRAHAEASDQDGQRRGFGLERGGLTAPDRRERLLPALAPACWWAHQLGLRAIRAGERHRFDRADRRDLGVVRRGRRWLATLLAANRQPPLPFRPCPAGWLHPWLA